MSRTGDEVFDVLVIGAGAGGMAAAARLNHLGYRTLLAESRDRVGGRASTIEIDGFRVNTGALILETGGENGKLFDELGVPMGTRLPARPLVLRLGKRDVPVMNGVIGAVLKTLVALLGITARRFPGLRPSPERTLADVTLRRGPFVRGLMRNLTSALFAAEPADVRAALLFDYLTKPKALDTYAMHPEGSIGPWRALADQFQRTGGVLWLNSEVTRLTFDDAGHVDGATVRRDWPGRGRLDRRRGQQRRPGSDRANVRRGKPPHRLCRADPGTIGTEHPDHGELRQQAAADHGAGRGVLRSDPPTGVRSQPDRDVP